MNGNMKVIKGYAFYDTLYINCVPSDLLEEWGHKEKAKLVYMVVSENEYSEIIETGTAELKQHLTFDTEEKAIEEMNDWNE